MAINYKKSLGQNFIYDLNYLQRMVKPLNIQPTDFVVEVGTGAGTLTKVMALSGCQIQTVEIDQSLAPVLQKQFADLSKVKLVFGDALAEDFGQLPNFRLIANVPYYITTPLLMKFLTAPNCLDLNILVAKEVAERIVAPVGSSSYGALSVACQLQADCKILQTVPKTMFTPKPKIDSAFVQLVKKENCVVDAGMSKFLKAIFSARRKTMLNALAGALKYDKMVITNLLQAVGINPELRPEQIAPTDFWKIYQNSRNFDQVSLL